jgi:hypothetical protein
MERQEAVEYYRRYQDALESLDARPKLAQHETSFAQAAAGLLAGEFEVTAVADVRALANLTNEFVYNWRKLQAWGRVLDELPQRQHVDVLLEFVNPAAYFCLCAPAAIKGRLYFSVARVSNIANERAVRGCIFTDDLGMSSPDNARGQAKHWTSWPNLSARLGALDNKEFKRTTGAFRNEFHHGDPRLLGAGTRPVVARLAQGVQALCLDTAVPISEVAAALTPQVTAAVAAHSAFLDLVEEQWSALMSNKRFDPMP